MKTTALLCALLCPAFALAALDKTITMYHVNPLRYGPIPRNMDTADVVGDLFFELFEVLSIPLACADPTVDPSKKPFECRNREANDPTDVVNKLTVQVDSHFSGYAACNIGTVNNTDPFGGACPAGTYCCNCQGPRGKVWPPPSVPCNATVGFGNLFEKFGNRKTDSSRFRTSRGTSRGASLASGWNHTCVKDYDCWTDHASAKLSKQEPGFWYSSLEYGDCSKNGPGKNCTWNVTSVDKVVNKTCHSNSFFGAVQAAAPNPSCFKACGGTHAAPNASDPCWIRCFYAAVLGPDAAKPTGWAVAGLPLKTLASFWSAPFESEDPTKGGCPGLPTV